MGQPCIPPAGNIDVLITLFLHVNLMKIFARFSCIVNDATVKKTLHFDTISWETLSYPYFVATMMRRSTVTICEPCDLLSEKQASI